MLRQELARVRVRQGGCTVEHHSKKYSPPDGPCGLHGWNLPLASLFPACRERSEGTHSPDTSPVLWYGWRETWLQQSG